MITLLRHAESTYNLYNLDEINCDLSDNGVKQAFKLKGHYDMVIVSPLKRAMNTLKLSKITYDKLENWNDVREKRDNLCDFIEGEHIDFESEDDLLVRINNVKNKLNKLTGNILIVTHADFIWYFTSHISNDERFGKWVDNACSISINLKSN